MREREQKVKAELSRIEMSIERSRVGINQEEGERDYKCALQFYRRVLDVHIIP